MIVDRVRVYFRDGTSTVLNVLDDEEAQDRIVEMCEREGYGLDSLLDWSIEGSVEI